MGDPPISLFLLVFPLFWIALFWTIGQLTGWSRLARTYMAYHRPEGERYGGRSLDFGMGRSYGNAVTVTLSSEGIHLAMFPIFALGHSPMIIPWSMVTGVQENALFKSVRALQVQLEVEGMQMKVYLPPRARPTVDRYTRNRFARPLPAIESEDKGIVNVLGKLMQ